MRKVYKICMNTNNPNAIKSAKNIDALDKELRERSLGKFSDEEGGIIFDDKDEDEVCRLMDKYLLDKSL